MLCSRVSNAADKSNRDNGDTSLISALKKAVSNVKKCDFSAVVLAVGKLISLKEIIVGDMFNQL